MKAVVAAFNQEKALVGAFSVITNLRMELFEALVDIYTAGDLGPAPSAEHVSCVDNVADFSSAFLFSVETQHTIG